VSALCAGEKEEYTDEAGRLSRRRKLRSGKVGSDSFGGDAGADAGTRGRNHSAFAWTYCRVYQSCRTAG
jgi:hypothetical protein